MLKIYYGSGIFGILCLFYNYYKKKQYDYIIFQNNTLTTSYKSSLLHYSTQIMKSLPESDPNYPFTRMKALDVKPTA